MARKTVPVATIVERGNHFLANSKANGTDQAKREAVASFVETLLHEADAYAGFNYLPSSGMVKDEEGYAVDFKDESRRFYYLHRKVS